MVITPTLSSKVVKIGGDDQSVHLLFYRTRPRPSDESVTAVDDQNLVARLYWRHLLLTEPVMDGQLNPKYGTIIYYETG